MHPLVLLHGFTGSPSSWDTVVEHLPGRVIVRPALLGHGADGPAPTTFEGELERLALLLPDGPFHLAGYSLGARLALCLALRQPRSVSRLTLIGVNPGLRDDAERTARRESDDQWKRLLAGGIGPFVDAWEAQPLLQPGPALDPDILAARRRQRLGCDPAGLALSLATVGLADMPDCWPLLPTLECPVTLMAGELDLKFVTLARAAAARLPHGTLRITPGAGHDLLLERPDLVAVELEND